jgi:large subunit ribosomal protein L3
MKFILGKKSHMTQIFGEDGVVYPVTAVKSDPVTVTQIKTVENDGYDAIQIGYGTQNPKRVGKAQIGHSKDLGIVFHGFKEFRMPAEEIAVKVGDTIDLSVFEKGEMVEVSAISKGKGFQGVVKRHGFAGGPRTHGQKHTERAPGSIGATGPQRVFKGTRMGGRMGTDRVTVKNLTVVDTDPKTNTLFIKGAIPGRPGTLVEIKA